MCARGHTDYVEGCWRCKIESVAIAPSATGSERAKTVNATDRAWSKDHDAYRRLRDQGLQPPHIDGSSQLEAGATTQREIEHGYLYTSQKQKRDVERAFDAAKEMQG